MSPLNELAGCDLADPQHAADPGTDVPDRVVTDSIGAFLETNKDRLARCVLDSVAGWEKFGSDRESTGLDKDKYARRQFGALIDYLALYFRSGDATYRHLFVGELLKIVHSPALGREEQQQKREEIICAVRRRSFAVADQGLSSVALESFRTELEPMYEAAASRARKIVNILCLGDCLVIDIVTFLAGPCREDGIDLNPTFLGSHNPFEFRKSIQDQPSDGFALVFYSPFTYTFNTDFSRTLKSRRILAGTESVRRMIAPGLDEVRANLEVIARHFECPVLVHNATNVRRHNAKLVDRVKIAMSWQARRIARREANWVLDQCVRNLAPSARVSVIDENSLLGRYSEWELGRRFYDSTVQHPTVLSRHLAALYHDYLTVHADLMTKKLVVCDLDNTLWEGEIGEGAVAHFRDRQATLKRLRGKGVLLAINSKNDPKNVHWAGSELDESDFVASRINWNSKSDNMREIRDALNLKAKDFVFIDDRPDQRDMVSASFPEILALDANSERTWRHLDLWSRSLPEQDGLDRTQLYHEREQRQSFITVEGTAVEPAVLMARLGLKATLRPAKAPDLKRVVDLINRTNQFNLNNSRTSLAELRDWLASAGKSVILVDGADKFGPMGTVCVALTEQDGRDVRIPIFVLSCRVFGYGFETAMLNAIKRLAARSGGAPRIIGLYRETPLNEPCRAMYPDHGFVWTGDHWIHEAAEPAADPSWLAVSDKTV